MQYCSKDAEVTDSVDLIELIDNGFEHFCHLPFDV